MFKGFNRSIWIRFWGITLLSIGNHMIRPFMALYLATAMGATLGMIGYILMVRPIGAFLGNMIGGYYADKIGRKPVMVVSISLDALCIFGYAMTDNLLWFALLSFFQGLTASAAEPANSAMIADVTTEENRSRAYSLIYMGVNVGAAVGPLLAVGVVMNYPKVLFAVLGSMTLLYALAVLFFLPESKPQNIVCESDACKKSQNKIGYGFVLRDKKLIYFLLGTFAIALGLYQIDSYLAIHINDILPGSLWLFGAMMSLNGIMCFLLAMPIAKFASRFDSFNVLKVGSALYALGMLIVALGQNAAFLLIGYAVLTLGEIVSAAVKNKILADIAPLDMRARYMSSGSLVWTGAAIIGLPAGGQLMQHFGGHMMFLVFALLMGVAVYFNERLHMKRLNEINVQEQEKGLPHVA